MRLAVGLDTQREARIVAREHERRVGRHVERAAREARGDRQLAAAAIREHRELDRGRTAIVEQLVERRAHGAPGVQHVVDEHDARAVDLERQRGRAGLAVQPLLRVVVAMQRDVDDAECRCAEIAREALGEPRAAAVNAGEPRAARFGERRAVRGADLVEQDAVKRLGVNGAHGRTIDRDTVEG